MTQSYPDRLMVNTSGCELVYKWLKNLHTHLFGLLLHFVEKQGLRKQILRLQSELFMYMYKLKTQTLSPIHGKYEVVSQSQIY